MWLDAKVKALCSENGGIHVYETVELTPDLLDEEGRIHIPFKSSMKAGDKYYSDIIYKTIFKDNLITTVKIIESRICVIRASDQKILGDDVDYARHGGGLPVYWYTREFRCPNLSRDSVRNHVFLKQDG